MATYVRDRHTQVANYVCLGSCDRQVDGKTDGSVNAPYGNGHIKINGGGVIEN